MRTSRTAILLAGAGLAASGCDYTHDIVDPGSYGVMTTEAGRSATPVVSGAAGNPAPPASNTAQSMLPATAPPATSATPAPKMMPALAAGAGAPAMTGAPDACDMSGKWLLALHTVTDGLGNLQYSHDYIYYELEQQADAVTVKKSLFCSSSTVGGGTFAVTVDYAPATQAALLKNVKDAGRKGTSMSVAGGCKIHFAKQYRVLGATLPYYLDPATTLPSSDDIAANGKPGWEDWDSDGQPGVTGICSGTVNGKIFIASRQWNVLSGTVPNLNSVIKLAVDWDVEPNVMAFDGSPFLGSSAVRAADSTLHFAQLARLSNDQVAADDATTCKNLVALAPMLTPEAAGM